MKKILLFVLILFVFGCKKKEKDPDPIPEGDLLIIKSFTVPGIPNANISVKDGLVIIKLPADYQGDLMRPDIQVPAGVAISGIDSGFDFQGKSVEFLLEGPENQTKLFQVIVVSEAPIRLLDAPKGYETTIEPYNAMTFKVPVVLPGTALTIGPSGNVVPSFSYEVKNKADGSKLSENVSLDLSTDSTGNEVVVLNFSPMIDAGEYDVSVDWAGKTVLLPPVRIKYGKTIISNAIEPATQTDSELRLNGFNVYPEKKYELVLENDFNPARKLSLTRRDYHSLAASIPQDLATGGYKVTVLVNGQPQPNQLNSFFTPVNFVFKKSPGDPHIQTISQPSKRVTSSNMYSYYESTDVISRKEHMLVYVKQSQGSTEQDDLKLVNRTTKQQFILKNPGISILVGEGAQMFAAYSIPDELPDGQYEASLVSHETTQDLSDRYIHILTIQ